MDFFNGDKDRNTGLSFLSKSLKFFQMGGESLLDPLRKGSILRSSFAVSLISTSVQSSSSSELSESRSLEEDGCEEVKLLRDFSLEIEFMSCLVCMDKEAGCFISLCLNVDISSRLLACPLAFSVGVCAVLGDLVLSASLFALLVSLLTLLYLSIVA